MVIAVNLFLKNSVQVINERTNRSINTQYFISKLCAE
jgi:hypothetical protein